MEVRNASGDVLRTLPTPHFWSAQRSFNVTGRVYVVPDEMQRDFLVNADRASGSLIVINGIIHQDLMTWSRVCRDHGCVGIVVHNIFPSWCGLFAWSFIPWPSEAPAVAVYEGTPIVNVCKTANGDPEFDWIVKTSRDAMLFATIVSGDYNDAIEVLASPLIRGMLGVSAALNVVGLLMVLYQYLSFRLDSRGNGRSVPFRAMLVFTMEAFAFLIRMVYFTNGSACRFQCLNGPVYRFTLTTSQSFMFFASGTVALSMHEHWMAATAWSVARTRIVFVVYVGTPALLMVHLITETTAAISQSDQVFEYISPVFFPLYLYALNIFLSVAFIKYGRIVAQSLTSNTAVNPEQRYRSLQFARRVTYSGVVSALIIVLQLVFILLFQRSVAYFLVLYAVNNDVYAIASYMRVMAFRPKPSITDAWFRFSRVTTRAAGSRPNSTYDQV